MKKILTLSVLALSTTTYANNVDALKGHEIIGDSYWSNYDKEAVEAEVSRFNLHGIRSGGIEKTLKESAENSVSQVRREMLQSTAVALGTQAGLANGNTLINRVVEEYHNKNNLDSVYKFSAIMLEPGFLPPVISLSTNAYQQHGDNEVRAAGKIYKIEIPARIVNASPTWRTYLHQAVSEPEKPGSSTLPSTSAEKRVWDLAIEKGWKQGMEQAKDLFFANKARLDRDFKGMILYKELYEDGMVTKPKLTRKNLGVTGGGDEMAVDDRVIKKTSDAKLVPNKNAWFK